MAAEKGSAFLLKIHDGSAYVTVAGMRTTQMGINAESVDVTNKGSQGWREFLPNAGLRSVSITGSGVFTNSAGERLIQTKVMDGSLGDFQILFESGDYFSGQFLVTNMEYAGDFNGERTYTLQLNSSGPISFTDV